MRDDDPFAYFIMRLLFVVCCISSKFFSFLFISNIYIYIYLYSGQQANNTIEKRFKVDRSRRLTHEEKSKGRPTD